MVPSSAAGSKRASAAKQHIEGTWAESIERRAEPGRDCAQAYDPTDRDAKAIRKRDEPRTEAYRHAPDPKGRLRQAAVGRPQLSRRV